jgi:catechol 2,3-dioxygenase-like lactoylglutathione lyase family enzyme
VAGDRGALGTGDGGVLAFRVTSTVAAQRRTNMPAAARSKNALPTFGLTHIALAVRDPETSAKFYKQMFGCTETYRDDTKIEVTTPGDNDIITLDRTLPHRGRSAGIAHFGFRLKDPKEIDAVVDRVKDSGGKLRRRGEFAPGFPFAYFADPDGYEVEVWYE